jgi:hypothetical protein
VWCVPSWGEGMYVCVAFHTKKKQIYLKDGMHSIFSIYIFFFSIKRRKVIIFPIDIVVFFRSFIDQSYGLQYFKRISSKNCGTKFIHTHLLLAALAL